MGFYYSLDGRWITDTLEYPPICYLSPKGERDTKAALLIQKWYRKMKSKSL